MTRRAVANLFDRSEVGRSSSIDRSTFGGDRRSPERRAVSHGVAGAPGAHGAQPVRLRRPVRCTLPATRRCGHRVGRRARATAANARRVSEARRAWAPGMLTIGIARARTHRNQLTRLRNRCGPPPTKQKKNHRPGRGGVGGDAAWDGAGGLGGGAPLGNGAGMGLRCPGPGDGESAQSRNGGDYGKRTLPVA